MKFRLTADDVTDYKTFAEFARVQIGAPKPTGSGWGNLNAALKGFWKNHPDASWADLTRGVREMKDRRINPISARNVVWFTDNFIGRKFVKVDKPNDPVDDVITQILYQEKDDWEFRMRLLTASGRQRQEIVNEWFRFR